MEEPEESIQFQQAEESRKLIEDWKQTRQPINEIEHFKIPRALIQVLIHTDEYHGMIIYGEGGVGKTILILSEIKLSLKPEEWDYVNAYTTPLSFYNYLYQNRHKRVIILDDVEGLFNNPLTTSILKAILWDVDGKRIVQYKSTSEKLEAPDNFILDDHCKIFILCNKIPNGKDMNIRAMITRTISYNLSFNYNQKMEVIGQFLFQRNDLSPEQKEYVWRILFNNTSPATIDLNFRTLKKVIAFVKLRDYKEAERLFQATTEIDTTLESYLLAIHKANDRPSQIAIFKELTGLSRATFYRISESQRKMG